MKAREIADELIAFYEQLTDSDVPENTAGVCTIELTKALIAGNVQPAGPAKDDLEAAAAEKRARRQAELADRR